MRKLTAAMLALLLTLSFCACGEEPVFETLGELPAAAEPEQPGILTAAIPEEAAASAMESGSRTLYSCPGYEIALETMEGGDLNRTVDTLTGFGTDRITVVTSSQDDCARYDFVWTTHSDDGDLVGRAAVLDDGRYHYCLWTLAEADRAPELQETLQDLFSSVSLS